MPQVATTHVDWSLLVRALPVEGVVSHFLLPRAVPPMLCFALLRASSARRGQPPPSRSGRRPSRGKGSPLSPLPLAPSWTKSRQPSTPMSEFTVPPSSSAQVTIDHYHPSTSGLTTTSRSAARVHSSTTSTPSPPLTSSPSCRHRPHTVIFSHCRSTAVVSPFCPTTTHGFPLVRSSSPAPPCPVSRH
jgi:hypothetical protein